jgi:hypothetical protein
MADKLIRANGNIVINDDRSSSTSNDRWDIGDVRASLLTRTQFQARNGTDWELLDGTDVSGSALDTLVTLGSGSGLLPNATGKFMRMDDGGQDAQTLSATLSGSTQGDAMFSHTHSGPSHTHSGPSHSHSGTSLYAKINVVDGKIYQDTNGTNFTADKRSADTGSNATGSFNMTDSTNIGGNTGSGGTGSTGSGGTGSTGATSTGSGETRPVNITVNYFVKIN